MRQREDVVNKKTQRSISDNILRESLLSSGPLSESLSAFPSFPNRVLERLKNKHESQQQREDHKLDREHSILGFITTEAFKSLCPAQSVGMEHCGISF